MTDGRRKPAPDGGPPDGGPPPADGIGELPPIDGGDPDGETSPGHDPWLPELPDGGAADDPADDLTERQLRAFAEDLADFEEPAGDDPEDGAATEPCDPGSFEESRPWSTAEEEPPALDDDWFDDGADGPTADDPADALDAPETAAGSDPGDGDEEEARGLLDAEAAAFDADGSDDGWLRGDLESEYLGPARGRVLCAAFVSGALVAAGDGVYRLGADGLLHRCDEEEDEIGSIGVAVIGGAAFLGTAERGILRVHDLGRRLVPVGLPEAAGAPGPCRVVAQEGATGGGRLLALTGAGRLFASGDLGGSFGGPLLPERCLAVVAAGAGEAVVALVERGARAELLESRDLEKWSRIALPEPVAAIALKAPLSIAAGGGLLAIAAGVDGAGLFVSMDGGATFSRIPGLERVTALAVDPREPGWMAAATYRPWERVGEVRTSRDAGATWRTAFFTGLAGEREEACEDAGRVLSLRVEGEDGGVLVAVAGDGVYTARLPGRGSPH